MRGGGDEATGADILSPGAQARTGVELRTMRVTCSLDCPDSCAVIATTDLRSGRVVKIAGDPAHPVTRGFLCGKVTKYLDRVYSPERLFYPMRRRAGVPKGPLPYRKEQEAFERISWEEALGLAAAKLQQVSDLYGPESVLPYSYAGTIGQLGYGSMDRRFFHRLGASQLDRTICATAGGAALASVYGVKLGPEPQSFAKAKLILAWGANLHGNNIHLWPFVEEARRNGARLVVIDPYRTRTAALADLHLSVRPGTDTALAMGMMHVILREGLEDRAYIEACTHGFGSLRDRVLDEAYSPERVAAITGLPAQQIVDLARAYATAQPAAIRVNYGVQRTENGGTATRAILMLPLLTGAWKHEGGGVLLSTSGAFSFNKGALEMPELMHASPLQREARTVNMSRLGHALTELGGDRFEGPPVHALFVYNSNPAAVAPNQGAVLQGLRRGDLFTVVHDMFFTDTADYADLLLPAPTWLEQDDVQGAYGHLHVQLSRRAMEPMGEARSNVRLFAELAQRMGFREPCFRDGENELIEQALASAHPWHEGITRERLDEQFSMPLQVPRAADGSFRPFADASWFRTPSGKGQFYDEGLPEVGEDPLPAYVPEAASRLGQSFPLQMLPRKADNFMNSTFANIAWHGARESDRVGALEIHPSDAAERGIAEGDLVEVSSQCGSLQLRAQVSVHVHRGVVASTLGWNKLARDGHGVNVLTSERLTDIGGGATFFSTAVEVTRCASPLDVSKDEVQHA